jgi:hypothetical protein
VTQPSPAAAMGSGTLGRGGPGVSFTPAGRGAPAAAGYNKMSSGPKGAGSMESLDSTQSLTLSTYSYGSSTSTGLKKVAVKPIERFYSSKDSPSA